MIISVQFPKLTLIIAINITSAFNPPSCAVLPAIVAMPSDMFYNTGINTYIWIISNNKDEKRKGKIQLINAVGEEFFQKIEKYVSELWNRFETDGYIECPISNHRFKKDKLE